MTTYGAKNQFNLSNMSASNPNATAYYVAGMDMHTCTYLYMDVYPVPQPTYAYIQRTNTYVTYVYTHT